MYNHRQHKFKLLHFCLWCWDDCQQNLCVVQVVPVAVLRLAREHPFHTLYLLFALTKAGHDVAPSRSDCNCGFQKHHYSTHRVVACKEILDLYKKTGRQQSLIHDQVSGAHTQPHRQVIYQNVDMSKCIMVWSPNIFFQWHWGVRHVKTAPDKVHSQTIGKGWDWWDCWVGCILQ